MGTMAYDFVCLNNDGFDGLRRPRHILMQRLSHLGHKALFVSSAVKYPLQRISHPSLKLGGMKRIRENLYWYQPPAFLPGSGGRVRNYITLLARKILLRAVIKFLTREPRILFITVPDRDYIDILPAFHRDLIIYNIHVRFVDEMAVWG